MFRLGMGFLLCFTFSLQAQTLTSNNYGKAMNSHAFHFSDTLETVSVEGALSQKSERTQKRLNLVASLDYVEDSVVARTEADPNIILKYVQDIRTLNVGASYLFGTSRKFLLGVLLPLHQVLLTARGSLVTGGDLTRKTTLGDGRIYGKWRFSKDKAKWSMALMPELIVPMGDDKYLVSDGKVTAGLKFLLDRHFSSLSFYSYLGYLYGNKAGFLSINRSSRLEAGLGIFWRLSRVFGLNIETIGDMSLEKSDDSTFSVDTLLGARVNLSWAKIFGGLTLSGFETSGNENLGFYMGVKVPLLEVATPIDPGAKVILSKKEEKKVPAITERVKISNVTLFHFDKNFIKKNAKPALDKAAAIIVHYQDRLGTIVVEGHTDTRGPRKYNQKLSERRAKAVRDYLIMRGVRPEKILAVGYGEDQPIYKPERSRFERQQNRRAQFFVDETITIREI